MKPPSPRYLEKVAKQLFPEDDRLQFFIEALQLDSPPATNRAFIWKEAPRFGDPHPDFPAFVTFADKKLNEPEARDLYMLDPSSVFECLPLLLLSHTDVRTILDLCASPGGKSIFSWRLFKPELLVANEVIRKRLHSLRGNFSRLNLSNTEVVSLEVNDLASRRPGEFNLVIVDAPCSGQSLLLKGIENPGAFNPRNIEHNALRQRRIIANGANCVAPKGYLIYMTCTYASAENEGVLEWFMKKFPEFKAVECSHLGQFRSQITETPCYRVFPWDSLGAGGFTCLMRREG